MAQRILGWGLSPCRELGVDVCSCVCMFVDVCVCVCVLLIFVLIMLFFVLIIHVVRSLSLKNYFLFPVLTDVVNQLQIDMAQLKESMDLYVSMTPAKTVETNMEQENCIILSGFTEDQVCFDCACAWCLCLRCFYKNPIMDDAPLSMYPVWPRIVARTFLSFIKYHMYM